MTRSRGGGGSWLACGLALFVILGCAGAGDDDVAAPPASLPSVSAPPEIKPHELIGLDRDHLSGLLGPPDFKRDDGPAELWQYRANDCVLDVFLYVDPQQGGGHRVTLVKSRDRELVGAAPDHCISALLRARRASAAQGAG